MPELGGLGVLRALPKSGSPSVVIVSISGSETELAIEALQAGAVDIVTKPTPMATERLYELGAELVAKVKAAAEAYPRYFASASTSEESESSLGMSLSSTPIKLLVIGTSTGGPQALTSLFKQLPSGLPFPIAIALHIPAGYTVPLSARISQSSAVFMEEARQGMELRPGQAVIAPGGQHLLIRAEGGKFFATLSMNPRETLHHPSVDVLFTSAAESAGAGVLGLIMTGMGSDGLLGAQAIRDAGGIVLAESAASCVVYGMPRTVIEAGLVNEEATLKNLSSLILKVIHAPTRSGSNT
jgi:two-component system chemotaxis response regulator CheB